MVSTVFHLAFFGLLATSALAVPESCFFCAGTTDDCADISKEELVAANAVQSCVGTPQLLTGHRLSGVSAKDNVTRSFLEVIEKQLRPSQRADTIIGETACVKLTFTHPLVTDATFGYRGCVPSSFFDKGVCTILNHAVGLIAGDEDDCYSCSGELCNSGLRVFSKSSVLLALVSSLLLKLMF